MGAAHTSNVCFVCTRDWVNVLNLLDCCLHLRVIRVLSACKVEESALKIAVSSGLGGDEM